MTLKQLNEEIKKLLHEGVWASPFTDVKTAKELKELMKKPIPLKDATDILYDYIGDDQFFDELEDLKEEEPADMDVRNEVKYHLTNWIENIDSFRDVNPKAVEIVKTIIK